MDKRLREQSRQKLCFRRDDPTTFALPQLIVPDASLYGNDLTFHLGCAADASNYAKQLYGSSIASDIDLGFSRAFQIDEDALADLPYVADAVREPQLPPGGQQPLSLVISYRHTVPKGGRILNIHPEHWGHVLGTIKVVCQQAGRSCVRLWTDQILSSRKPAGPLRWVSCGILPYTIYPVLFVWREPTSQQSNHILLREDLRRMWISIEHLAASLGQGIIHCGDALTEDQLPLEWPTTYFSVGSQSYPSLATWMVGKGMLIHSVVRKVCGAIMCGLVRNKQLSWVDDAQDIIDWACAIVSTTTDKDLGHSYECEDCKWPTGYTSGHRLGALLSSSLVVDFAECSQGISSKSYPRLDIPALELSINGKGWDGFREWIPESALWGYEFDQIQHTCKKVTRLTNGLVTSPGGVRAIAILQFKMAAKDADNIYNVANMLVGLETLPNSRHVGKVEWTKRFWPVNPLRMCLCFTRLLHDNGDTQGLLELAAIIGASSGLDYKDIAHAREVETITMDRVKWR